MSLGHKCETQAIRSTLRGFCGQVSDLPSLYLLRDIEQTLDSLVEQRRSIHYCCELARGITKTIEVQTFNRHLDPDFQFTDHLENAERLASRFIDELKPMREAARRDPELFGHHEESIVNAYTDLIDEVETLYYLDMNLRWVILEKDADSDVPEGKSITSIEEFKQRIRA
ncbi:MAG: hypothetical protein R8K46_08215 [Mariprofundaceae bacterium]